MKEKNERLYELWPFNFGSIHEQDFNKAKVVIVPVAYEATTTYGKGASQGPHAIILSSGYLDELWDGEGSVLVGLKSADVYTLDEAIVSSNSSVEAITGVEQLITERVLDKNKLPLMLGGEHTITLGAVRALIKARDSDFSILQLDAHADLQDEFRFTKYYHGSVMRRALEEGVSITQVGVRNINTELDRFLSESPLAKSKLNTFYAPQVPVEEIIKTLKPRVYLTVDLDVFDPSIMPAVGAPEPGGLGWYEVKQLIERVAKEREIIGADVVELSPVPGLESPNFLAAKLVYYILEGMLGELK